jgi:arginyl-tRNA synthetase
MLDELMPNRLTDYLYGVSEAFNAFYTECKVGASRRGEGLGQGDILPIPRVPF